MSRQRLPSEFDGFRLIRQIGEGGMGRVFLAQDTLLDRAVAIKFIAADNPDPGERGRFLLEARAIARLQHPCVVSVFRVGDLDGRPYIVSEFVEGESLDKLAAPIPWRQALRIAHDLARGLTVAHRAGVVHRDIKPANAILAPDGTAKLLDFGIARLVAPQDRSSARAVEIPLSFAGSASSNDATRPVSIPLSADGPAGSSAAPFLRSGTGITTPGKAIGTPAFMAPEVWLGQTAGFSSDIYSLGALIYTLCSGNPPHRSESLEALRDEVCDVDALPLAEVAPEVDPAFGALVDRCLRRDPMHRYQTGGDLRLALSALLSPPPHAALPPGNPYRGLRPFEADHQALFFGRDSEIRSILDRLRHDPVVIVTGDSGVGKSSLCRAGVLPRIGDWLGGDLTWLIARAVPGHDPATAISGGIASVTGMRADEVMDALLEGPQFLGREIRRALSPGRGLVLFVDQLEELITLAEPSMAEAVATLFGRTRTPTPGFRIVATVRGDYLGRVASLPGIGEHLASTLYFLRPLSPERIREAILCPAQATGTTFESAATVDVLVEATPGTGGGLPLLQFALSKLWDARDAGRGVIPAGALDALGGVAGALSLHADEVLAGLGPAGRERARRLLLLLVTAEGTRARRTGQDLATDDSGPETLDALVSGRLVVATEGPDGPVYEIAHEALLSGWGTLARWLAIDADGRVLRARLAAACTEWERLDHPEDALWSARQVHEAKSIDPATLTAPQKDFLASSAKRIRRRRTRFGALAAVVLLALVFTAGGTYLKSKWELDSRVHTFVQRATDLNASAASLREKASGLRTRSLALFDERHREEAEAEWIRYKLAQADLDAALSAATREAEAAIALDPSRTDVRKLFAELLFERAEQAEREAEQTLLAELLQRMALYDEDGTMQERWSASATLTLSTTPQADSVRLEAYRPQDGGHLVPTVLAPPPALPIRGLSLPPGSYRLRLSAPGTITVSVPFVLSRSERLSLDIPLPPKAAVPTGFAFVPPGRFLVGSTQPDGLRIGFLHATPLHPVETGPYLIALRETTFADWLEYVAFFPADQRKDKLPSVHAGGFEGSLGLSALPDGRWKIDFQPTSTLYSATSGSPVRYPGRKVRSEQDWLRFPVVGITAADAAAYAAWLDRSGKLPGARLCTDLEWEKAARGADGREYPHGNALAPDEANFDETYAKDPAAMGPDEVGSHPASESPFGLHDVSGNVWEWVVTSFDPEGHAARGGSFYFDVNSARTCNRETPEPSFRDVSVGFRVCADYRPR